VLADMSKSRMQAKKDALTQALAGNFGAHHGVVTRQILDHIAFLDASIKKLTTEIAERLVPVRAGDRAALPNTRLGAQHSRGVHCRDRRGHVGVPHARAVGGLVGHGASNPRIGRQTARRSVGRREPLAWSGVDRSRSCRRTNQGHLSGHPVPSPGGPARAEQGVRRGRSQHGGGCLHMLSTGEAYRELGGDYYLRRDHPDRQARRLTRQLEQLGFNVSIVAAA
jgi:transposase